MKINKKGIEFDVNVMGCDRDGKVRISYSIDGRKEKMARGYSKGILTFKCKQQIMKGVKIDALQIEDIREIEAEIRRVETEWKKGREILISNLKEGREPLNIKIIGCEYIASIEEYDTESILCEVFPDYSGKDIIKAIAKAIGISIPDYGIHTPQHGNSPLFDTNGSLDSFQVKISDINLKAEKKVYV